MLGGVVSVLDPWEGIMGKMTAVTVEGMYTDNFRVAASPLLDPAVSVQIEPKPEDGVAGRSARRFEYLTPAKARELAALLVAAADQAEKGAGA